MTTVVLNTTTRKVEVFSSARDVQARAEIADHKAAADPHPQYLREADAADVATSGDATDVSYAAPGAGAVARSAAGVFGEAVRITDYGGVGDDSTDNTTAAASARAAAGPERPIVLNNGDYNVSQTPSLGSGGVQDALGTQWLLGTAAAPVTRHEPVLWVEKVSGALSGTHDHGAIYASIETVPGATAGASAFIAYGLVNGGSGPVHGSHNRVRMSHVNGGMGYATWSYLDVTTGTFGAATLVGAGHEINIKHTSGDDFGWKTATSGKVLIGLTIATADGATPGRAQHGILLQKHTGDGFYTGFTVLQDSICEDDAGNAEAIRIQGGSSSARRYTGIWFEKGHLRTGINLVGPTYHNNVAALLPLEGRISFGTNTDATRHLFADSLGRLNFVDTVNAAQLRLGRLHAHSGTATLTQTDHRGWDTTNNPIVYARNEVVAVSNTAGAAFGEWRVSAVLSGTLTQQMAARNGITVGAPTGSFKGLGTVNATRLYENGVAVVERGSNANGSYVRYSDGTQMCWHSINLGSRITFGAGTLADPYRSGMANWTFPVAFAATPQVVGTGVITSGVAAVRLNAITMNDLTAAAANAVQAGMLSSNATVVDVIVQLVATGTWS